MCNYHVIQFEKWEEYVDGSDLAANVGEVQCRPDFVLIVSDEQLEAIKEAGIPYGNGPTVSIRGETLQ